MNSIYIFIILISELFCMQYLPNEGIINLPVSSQSGYLYLRKADFPTNNYIYVFFRTFNGKMDSNISYINTDTYPISDGQFPNMYQKNYYKIDKSSDPIIYIYEIDPPSMSLSYTVIKYSGFSGKSITVGCSIIFEIAKYSTKGKIINLSNLSPLFKYGYIYLKYADFPGSNDIYVYIQISEGYMLSTIQYQETNVDPGSVISFPSPKEKTYDYSDLKGTFYFYDFSKSNYSYLIIACGLYSDSSVSVTSSIKSQYLLRGDTINLYSNYSSGYIYLKLKDFQTVDEIYIYFKTSYGEMNNYIEYITTDTPFYEELFNSLNKKDCDIIEKYSEIKVYVFEFKEHKYNGYLVIKYSGFSGNSITVSSSTKIRYLAKNNKIDVSFSNFGYGYIYLNYKDFSNWDDNKIYVYFKIIDGKMDENILYLNTDTYPSYEGQFSSMSYKSYDKKDNNNPSKYIYVFEKPNYNYNYLVIGYTGFTGSSLTIFSSSINLMPSSLSKDNTISLSYSSKSGFIYLSYYDFSYKDDIYIYFEVSGIMDTNISYINIDKDPSYGDYYTWLENKNYDNIDEKDDPKIYSFKFYRVNFNYLLIKYSGFSGSYIKVSCSTKNPFALSTVLIILIVIGSIIVVGILIIILIIYIHKRKKRIKETEEKEKFTESEPNNLIDSNQNNSQKNPSSFKQNLNEESSSSINI